MATVQQQRYYRGEMERVPVRDELGVVGAINACRSSLEDTFRPHLRRLSTKDDEEEIRYASVIETKVFYINWEAQTRLSGHSAVAGSITVNMRFHAPNGSHGSRLTIRFDALTRDWTCRVLVFQSDDPHHRKARDFLLQRPVLRRFLFFSDEGYTPFRAEKIPADDAWEILTAFRTRLPHPGKNGKAKR